MEIICKKSKNTVNHEQRGSSHPMDLKKESQISKRHLLPFTWCPSTESLVHAFISSRLDYCNSLLYGLPNCSLIKLQRVQNACARLIFAEGRYCHITPLLIKLHWLPIQSRIVFKILLLTFKILHGTAPTYLDSLISLKPQSCYNLRSSCDTLLLMQPSFKSKVTLGDRSFSCAAPKLWNALPFEVRDSKSLDIFKSRLKTHLFRLAFLS